MASMNRPFRVKVDEDGPIPKNPPALSMPGPVALKGQLPLGQTRISTAPPVYVNKPHPTDFPWLIQWNTDTCIRCGACVAACTFGSIEAKLMRQGQAVSVGSF